MITPALGQKQSESLASSSKRKRGLVFGSLFLLSLGIVLFCALHETPFDAQLWPSIRSALVFNGILIISLFLLGALGYNYLRVYILSLFVRLVFILLIILFPPRVDMPVMFPDALWYTDLALNMSHYPLHSMNPRTQYELVSMFMALVFQLFGRSLLWVRLVNVLFSSFSCVLMYYTASLVVGKRGRQAAFWLAPFLPNFVFWSYAILKESLFIFGIALLAASGARVDQEQSKSLVTFFFVVFGIGIVFSLRRLVVLFALAPFIAVTIFEERLSLRKVFLMLLVLTLLLTIIPLGFEDITNRLENITSSGTPMSAVNTLLNETHDLETFHPLVQYLNKANRSIQIVFSPLVLLLLPTHTAIVSFLTLIGDPGFWTNTKAAFLGASWWFSLPFLVKGIAVSLKRRNVFWRTVAGVAFIWFFVSAYGRGIVSFESVRIREHLNVFYFLLACKGIDTLDHGSLQKGEKWWWLLRLYYGGLLLSAAAYTWI
jgi:hypothetical protein